MIEKLSSNAFRSVFKYIDKEALRWFPGHMDRGMKQMQHKLRQIDCIVEVHDARIPLSGRNPDFQHTIAAIDKPHILVLNKVDLIPQKSIEIIKKHLIEKENIRHILFTNCKDQKCRGVRRLFPLAAELINSSERYNRSTAEDFCFMIIGVPNVGKSSLVNALRVRHLNKGNASTVGAVPGVTRSVLNKIKMSDNPLVYMLDTPGILTPNIANIEIGLKLALCGTLQDHLVGETTLADYLLFSLNKYKQFDYVKYFGLSSPCDDILEILDSICFVEKKFLRVRNSLNEYVYKPNFNVAASIMLKAFRSGNLGTIILDKV